MAHLYFEWERVWSWRLYGEKSTLYGAYMAHTRCEVSHIVRSYMKINTKIGTLISFELCFARFFACGAIDGLPQVSSAKVRAKN